MFPYKHVARGVSDRKYDARVHKDLLRRKTPQARTQVFSSLLSYRNASRTAVTPDSRYQ